jgi:hypothetical protein
LQPFYSTSVMSRLVKMAEEHINTLVVKQQAQGSSGAAGSDADVAAAVEAATATTTNYTPAAADTAPTPAGEAAAEAADAAGEAAAEAAAEPSSQDRERSSSPDDSSLPVDTAVFARTRMALQMWDQLCSNASTPSTVLPAGSSELVRQLKVRERWARLVGVPPGAAAPALQGESQGPEQQQQQGDDAVAATAAAAGGHELPVLEGEAAAKRQRC